MNGLRRLAAGGSAGLLLLATAAGAAGAAEPVPLAAQDPASADALPALQDFDGTIRWEPVAHTYPADGSTLVLLGGSVVTRDGEPRRTATDVSLTTTAGSFVGTDASVVRPGFHVIAKNGQFSVVLKAPVQSGPANVTATVAGVTATVQIVFTTALQQISAGSVDVRIGANRSDYYSPFERFLTDDTRSSFATSAFVAGPIGQTQLTAAVESTSPINGDCSGLTPIYGSAHELQAPSCRPRYPVLGDSSTITPLADSSDNVFLRLEHDANFAEWGDYDTHEFNALGQTYAATARVLHGAKAGYTDGRLSLTGLFATGIAAFARDLIAPNGTSGSYFLSRRLVVPGSENVTLELEPLNRPGTIVSVTALQAGVDYELDPVNGSLLFRVPVAQTQIDAITGATLVRHIAVSYQYDAGASANAVGGRAQYRLADGAAVPSAIGISTFHENMGADQFALTSADAMFEAGKAGTLSGEVARSHSLQTAGPDANGTAYRLEDRLDATHLKARAFVTHSDPDFVNDAAAQSFVAGQTRYGASVDDRLNKHTAISLSADEERDLGSAPAVLTDAASYLVGAANAPAGQAVDSRLSTIGASIAQGVGVAAFNVALNANAYRDAIQPAYDTRNTQATARAVVPLGPRWSVSGEVDQALSGGSSLLFPDRRAVGAAYKVSDGVTLGATTQALEDGAAGARHFTSLDAYLQPHIGQNTDLTAKYSLVGGQNGFSAQQEIGLNHRLLLAKHVRGDIGFEHVDGSLFNLTAAGMQFAQPYAAGTNSAGLGLTGGTTYHVGAEFVGDPALRAGGRLERSTSNFGSDTVVRLNASGKLNERDKVLASFDRSEAANQLLGALPGSSDLNVGFALRDPNADSRNILLMYEARSNPGLLPTPLLTAGQVVQQNTLLEGGNVITHDATLSVEGIASVTPRLELYAKFAGRRETTQLAPDLTTPATLRFAQFRTRYELGRRYDVTVEGRTLLQSGYAELGYVGEGGYLLSPELRAALGYAGGRIDQSVFDSERHGGVYLDLTMRVQNLWRH